MRQVVKEVACRKQCWNPKKDFHMNTEVPKTCIVVMCPMVSAGMKSVTQAYSVIYAIAAVALVFI